MNLHQAVDDGWQEDEIDETRVELAASPLLDHPERRLDAAPSAIAPMVADGVEGVGDGDDAGLERNA